MNAVVRFEVDEPEAMEAVGGALAALLRAGDLVILKGELGAGKTTLTRGIGAGLGVRGSVTSPTFVLARTHPRAAGGAPLVHVDAYRLGDARELDDLDLDWAASIAVVEWGDGLLDGVADAWLRISIDRPRGGAVDDEELDAAAVRVVTVESFGSRWTDAAAAAGLAGLAAVSPDAPTAGGRS